MRALMPSFVLSLLLAFAFCLYIPLVSYYSNQNEFYFGAKALALAMLVPALCLAGASFFLLVLLRQLFSYSSRRLVENNMSPVHVFVLLVLLCVLFEGFILGRGSPQRTDEMHALSFALALVKDFIVWLSALWFGLWIWRSVAVHFTSVALCLALFLSFGIADAVWENRTVQAERTTSNPVLHARNEERALTVTPRVYGQLCIQFSPYLVKNMIVDWVGLATRPPLPGSSEHTPAL